jgi:hypothetical protein
MTKYAKDHECGSEQSKQRQQKKTLLNKDLKKKFQKIQQQKDQKIAVVNDYLDKAISNFDDNIAKRIDRSSIESIRRGIKRIQLDKKLITYYMGEPYSKLKKNHVNRQDEWNKIETKLGKLSEKYQTLESDLVKQIEKKQQQQQKKNLPSNKTLTFSNEVHETIMPKELITQQIDEKLEQRRKQLLKKKRQKSKSVSNENPLQETTIINAPNKQGQNTLSKLQNKKKEEQLKTTDLTYTLNQQQQEGLRDYFKMTESLNVKLKGFPDSKVIVYLERTSKLLHILKTKGSDKYSNDEKVLKENLELLNTEIQNRCDNKAESIIKDIEKYKLPSIISLNKSLDNLKIIDDELKDLLDFVSKIEKLKSEDLPNIKQPDLSKMQNCLALFQEMTNLLHKREEIFVKESQQLFQNLKTAETMEIYNKYMNSYKELQQDGSNLISSKARQKFTNLLEMKKNQIQSKQIDESLKEIINPLLKPTPKITNPKNNQSKTSSIDVEETTNVNKKNQQKQQQADKRQAFNTLINEKQKIMQFVEDTTKEIENQIQNDVDDDNVSSIKVSINNVEKELKNMIQSFQNSKEYKTLENDDKLKNIANTYKEELDELSKNYDENTKSNLLFLLHLRQKYDKSKNLPSNEERLKILKEIKKELDDRLRENDGTRWSTSIGHFHLDIIDAINKTESEISKKKSIQNQKQRQREKTQRDQKRNKKKQNFDNLRVEKTKIQNFFESKRDEIQKQIQSDTPNAGSIEKSIKSGKDELNQMIQTTKNSNLYKDNININTPAWSNLTRVLNSAPKRYQTMKAELKLKLERKLDMLKQQKKKQLLRQKKKQLVESINTMIEDVSKALNSNRGPKTTQIKNQDGSNLISGDKIQNLDTQTNTNTNQQLQQQKQKLSIDPTTTPNLDTPNTTNQVKKQQQQPTKQKNKPLNLGEIESALDKLDVSKHRERINLDGSTTTGKTTKTQMQNQFARLNKRIKELKTVYENDRDKVNKLNQLNQLQKRSNQIKQNNKQIYNFFELQKNLKRSSNDQQNKDQQNKDQQNKHQQYNVGKILEFLTRSNNIKKKLEDKNIPIDYQKLAKKQLLTNLEQVVNKNKSTNFTKVDKFLEQAEPYFPEQKFKKLIQTNRLNQQKHKKRLQEQRQRKQRQKLQQEKARQKLLLQQKNKNKLSSIQSKISSTTGNQQTKTQIQNTKKKLLQNLNQKNFLQLYKGGYKFTQKEINTYLNPFLKRNSTLMNRPTLFRKLGNEFTIDEITGTIVQL